MAKHPDGYYYYRINDKVFSFLHEMEEHKGKEVLPDEEPYKTKWSEFSAQAYARKRQAEYPSVGDQLDMMMKDMKNGTTTHQTACEAVKTKYPKT